MNKRRIVVVLMIATLTLVGLRAYDSISFPESGGLAARPAFAPLPSPGDSHQEEAYAAAQATLLAGHSEISGLSQQATIVSLNMDQAANVAAQATMDHNQRQLMELSIRATEVSQNVARAAATEQFIREQTQMQENAAASAQSQASTAAYSAYVQANQTTQANATRTAYSLTATPWAAIQANMARTRNDAERRAWREEFVATLLEVVPFALIVLLLIVGGLLARQRLMPLRDLRLRTISRYDDRPLRLMDSTIVVYDPPSRRLRLRKLHLRKQLRSPSDATPRVEIVDPSEPFIANWITEAEQKLRADRRIIPNHER